LKMDSILIGDMSGDIEFIFHFQWLFLYLKDIKKLFFFVCYTNICCLWKGQLVYMDLLIWGENIKHQRSFFYELESRETTSTFDDEWNYVGTLT
jgi:hypothetical protein